MYLTAEDRIRGRAMGIRLDGDDSRAQQLHIDALIRSLALAADAEARLRAKLGYWHSAWMWTFGALLLAVWVILFLLAGKL